MKISPLKKILNRIFTSLLFPLLLFSLLFANPDPTQAARGGRIGGGSFRAPSMPRSGGYGGGGYRGGYGGYGGYRGGGIGFPFLLPIFGFGGGGLFGFLILMTIAGVIVNSIRGTNFSANNQRAFIENSQSRPPVTIIQLQLGLLASAKSLQEDLRKIAASSDTNTSKGLQRVLQETTLSLLRHPALWVYANAESGSVPFSSAESTFNRLSMTERSKLQEEITSNISGKLLTNNSTQNEVGEAGKSSEYIAITLLIASTSQTKINDGANSEKLKDNLRLIGSIPSSELIALEVIWQPDGEGDVLSAEELVTSYPNLKHL